MKRLVQYLSLNQIGALELVFAFYCILSGYGWGIVKGNILFLLIMAIIAYLRKKKNDIQLREIKWLMIFVAIHESVLAFVINAPGYMINNTISALLSCLFMFPIVKAIRMDKLIGAINCAAIVSIVGIVYHYLIIRSGGTVTPIPFPLLGGVDANSRLYEEGLRPTSFYWEPAAFVTYMMVPLFLSLKEKKYIWSAIIIASMFLSTSTTGITMSLLMLVCYVFTQKVSMKSKTMITIIACAFIWMLFSTDLFSAGMDKIENTDIESASRTINGPAMVFNMPTLHLVTGMPAANPYDYYISGGFKSLDIIIKDDTIFCSTIWLVLAKYGIIGILLFLWLYIKPLKTSREILPYMVMLFASMFFQSYTIGTGGFVFQLIFIYVFVYTYRKQQMPL